MGLLVYSFIYSNIYCLLPSRYGTQKWIRQTSSVKLEKLVPWFLHPKHSPRRYQIPSRPSGSSLGSILETRLSLFDQHDIWGNWKWWDMLLEKLDKGHIMSSLKCMLRNLPLTWRLLFPTLKFYLTDLPVT